MKRIVGAFLIIALAMIGSRFTYLKISDSSWFSLTDIRFKCPETIDTSKLAEVADFKLGESVFKQDLITACKNLSELAGIEEVNIRRILPHGIEIDIMPDKAELMILAGKVKGLTRRLKIIDMRDRKTVLPVVTGIKISSKPKYDDRLKMSYAFAIFDKLTFLSKNLSSRLSEIHFRKDDKIELYFNPSGAKAVMNLAYFELALQRLCIIDDQGLLGNSGSFDLSTGRIVIKNRT